MATIITNKPHKVAWIDFVNQTGATDRKPLLDFVTGCFDLGIWDNMVCWPLRSSQQLTTGTSVISLGGLGSYNGTLVNSPTIGATGMTTVRDSSHRAVMNVPAVRTFTALSVMARTATNDTGLDAYYWEYSTKQDGIGNNWYFDYLKYGSEDGVGIVSAGTGGTGMAPQRLAPNNTTDFGFQSFAQNNSIPATVAGLNGVFATATTPVVYARDMVEIGIGHRWAGGYVSHSSATHAFFGHVTYALSTEQVEDFRTLYKSTLGQGLGLP